MTSSTVETLQLLEWEEAFLPKDRLGSETARALIEDHTKHVDLDYPSPKTDGHWRLGPKGYIGILPVDRDTVLALEPKVPIENVFRMLEYAYRLRAFPWPDKTIHAESIAELFESLARILARRIRDRTRKGLHRRYVERDERLPFVRGRVELRGLTAFFGTRPFTATSRSTPQTTRVIGSSSGLCSRSSDRASSAGRLGAR